MAGARIKPTEQQAKWLEVYFATEDAIEATRQAYNGTTEESIIEMSRQIMRSPTIRREIINKNGLDGVFTKKYLMNQLQEEIEDGKGSARVAAIRLAAEIMGHIAPKATAAKQGKDTAASLSSDLIKRLDKFNAGQKPS